MCAFSFHVCLVRGFPGSLHTPRPSKRKSRQRPEHLHPVKVAAKRPMGLLTRLTTQHGGEKYPPFFVLYFNNTNTKVKNTPPLFVLVATQQHRHAFNSYDVLCCVAWCCVVSCCVVCISFRDLVICAQQNTTQHKTHHHPNPNPNTPQHNVTQKQAQAQHNTTQHIHKHDNPHPLCQHGANTKVPPSTFCPEFGGTHYIIYETSRIGVHC